MYVSDIKKNYFEMGFILGFILGMLLSYLIVKYI
jgi:hypothetical protein